MLLERCASHWLVGLQAAAAVAVAVPEATDSPVITQTTAGAPPWDGVVAPVVQAEVPAEADTPEGVSDIHLFIDVHPPENYARPVLRMEDVLMALIKDSSIATTLAGAAVEIDTESITVQVTHAIASISSTVFRGR